MSYQGQNENEIVKHENIFKKNKRVGMSFILQIRSQLPTFYPNMGLKLHNITISYYYRPLNTLKDLRGIWSKNYLKTI